LIERLLSSLGASQRRNGSPILRILDELCESLQPSIIFLRTDNPECCYSLVPRSLGSEELPSLLVSTKLLFEGSAQLCGLSLLIGVNRRSFIRASFEGFDSGRLHAPKADEFLGASDVYRAPSTAGFSCGEPIRITSIIYSSSNTIDPAEAECLVNSFRLSNARFARIFLVKSDPDLRCLIMILLKPLVEFRGSGEK